MIFFIITQYPTLYCIDMIMLFIPHVAILVLMSVLNTRNRFDKYFVCITAFTTFIDANLSRILLSLSLCTYSVLRCTRNSVIVIS